MVRSIAQIYDEIMTAKEALSPLGALAPANDTATALLAELTSGSRAAVWRLWAYVVAVAHHAHELLFDLFKKEVEGIIAAAPAGTARWYQAQMLAFQLGDALTFTNGKLGYAAIDPAKQIVKRCAVTERPDGALLVKLAKLDGQGRPAPLDALAELAPAIGYAQKIKFAGTRLSVVSLAADRLRVGYEIFFDPISPEATVRANIAAAIEAYLENLPFNGRLSINALTDAIQRAEGVIDPVAQLIEASSDSGATWQTVSLYYVPQAGYLEIDPASPLSATLALIPQTA